MNAIDAVLSSTHRPVTKIISGGQTGADQAGLAAAKALGLQTGGWAPKGYRTDAGPRPDLYALYGVLEHPERGYPHRTRANVYESDGTLIFGDDTSPGCRLTARLCRELKKSCFTVPWLSSDVAGPDPRWISMFRRWLRDNRITTLNVAGNREASAPGIFEACRAFLMEALS